MKSEDACDTTAPLLVTGTQDVRTYNSYTVEAPSSRSWLVSVSVDLSPEDGFVEGSMLYLTDIRSLPFNTSTDDVTIYYISEGWHHANLKHPLLVEKSFQFRSRMKTSSLVIPVNIEIPLKKYQFHFLSSDVDYCSGHLLCSGLVSLYTERYRSLRTVCKDLDVSAMQAKYGHCKGNISCPVAHLG